MNEVVVLSLDKLYGEVLCSRLKAASDDVIAQHIAPHPRHVNKLLDEIGSRSVLIDLQTVAMCKNVLAAASPNLKRVLVVPEAKPEHVEIAKNIGATAIVPTSLEGELLSHALILAIKGGAFFPSALWDRAVFRASYSRDGHETVSGVSVSRKERAILEALGRGATNKVIADDLGLSEGTVKVYLSRLCKKFQASNRTQLLLKVMNEA